MNNKSTNEFISRLNSKYQNIKIHNVTDNQDGSQSLVISGQPEGMESAINRLGNPAGIRSLPIVDDVSKLRIQGHREYASTIARDALSRPFLDLAQGRVTETTPQELYTRSVDYYRKEDIYGSCIDLLSNFASKGYKNEIDDDDIRNFYNNWVVDAGVDEIVEKIFFEFFRSGFVRTFKAVSKYEPKINYVSNLPSVAPKQVLTDVASANKRRLMRTRAAKKIKWSKDMIPVRYTILNPTQLEVEAGSILFTQQLISIKAAALESIKKLLEVPTSDLTEHQQKILKAIPADLKAAAQDGKDYSLDPYLVGQVDYRRQPYELYPFPRGARAFEAIEYKRELRKADYSTLDGITNYLLIVTIGNDEFPVKTQEELEAVAELFNTPSKSFDVVWNHTLKVQRIEPSNVGDILGQEKYKQVNEDITGAFGVVRALIDGNGPVSKAAIDWAVKAVQEEIEYARTQVKRWIYREYRDVAEGMGFDRYPKVRFDTMVLKDELRLKALIQGLIDRRVISYRTGHDELGYDHTTQLREMEIERDLILDGTLGLIGSPYQQAGGGNVQDTQRTPKGTPSEGRPSGTPAPKTPKPATKPNKPDDESAKALALEFGSIINQMDENSIMVLMEVLINKSQEFSGNKEMGDGT